MVKLNPQKCNFMCFGNEYNDDDFIFNGRTMLSISKDNKLKCDQHVKTSAKAAKKYRV